MDAYDEVYCNKCGGIYNRAAGNCPCEVPSQVMSLAEAQALLQQSEVGDEYPLLDLAERRVIEELERLEA